MKAPQRGTGSAVTVLLFSKDRALQCDGALRSFFAQCVDVDTAAVVVLYACSSELHARTYARLRDEWPRVRFEEEADFRADVLRLLARASFVLFLVDDSVAVRGFALAPLCDALRSDTRILGVSLRLGRDTRYCYSLSRPQRAPSFDTGAGGLLRFRWPKADGDYGYTLEISSSLYRREDVAAILESSSFSGPTSLEDRLAEARPVVAPSKPFLLCPETPYAFSNPLNRVQHSAPNRMGSDPGNDPALLASLFERGELVDTRAYDGFRPNACHQEVPLVLESYSEGDVPWTRAAGPAPLISVLMPARNAAPFLREAVDGILAQTLGDFELLLFDDGSTDATRAMAAGIPDARIRIAGTRAARGIVDALNACLREARGRFIARADADDIAHPLRFERQLAFLAANPDVGLCGTWMTSFGDGVPNLYAFPARHEEIVAELLFNPSVVHPTVMFRAALSETGDVGWRAGYEHAEDYEWLIRLSSHTRFANVEESLYSYRVHAGQVGALHGAEQAAVTSRLQRELLERLLPDVDNRRVEMHTALTRWALPSSLVGIEKIHAWFLTLVDANDRLGIYDRAAFRAVLARRFFFICGYAATLGPAAWAKVRRLPLHRAASVTWRSRLSQCRSFLLRRDVPGRRHPEGAGA